MSRVFEARYAGQCGACEGSIHEGDQVRYDADQLVHDVCPEPLRPALLVCGACFLETAVNGSCGCDQ